MLVHTEGIVFSTVKFKETSIIVKIFTSAYGMQSYIVNGARSQRSKGKIALYQPLSLLDMVVYYKEGKDIQRISETKFAQTYTEIPFDPVKRTIGIFITEVFGKVLREEGENSVLFEFLFNSLQIFDRLRDNVANFHLQILLKATHHLGFGPANADDFVLQLSESGFHLSISLEEKKSLDLLMESNYGENIPLSLSFRREVLDHIIKYYKVNSGNLREIKSLSVLKVIFE
ncbi:DNA repair protein RecO [Roseivirga misakiensis]|uniref:DNA repair protein RecO n=1 Tax=Roseivirga misakiensis TaxID=1563681 RepID=A0A1E5T613_9BACT|nr:DNA repair protein RecO [Roseivirga misakiensis]OEK06813.1 DNA repair protein RecO [Roseivirga misakiensis]